MASKTERERQIIGKRRRERVCKRASGYFSCLPCYPFPLFTTSFISTTASSGPSCSLPNPPPPPMRRMWGRLGSFFFHVPQGPEKPKVPRNQELIESQRTRECSFSYILMSSSPARHEVSEHVLAVLPSTSPQN